MPTTLSASITGLWPVSGIYSSPRDLKLRPRLGLFVLLCWVLPARLILAGADIHPGEQIYRMGLLPDGRPLTAVTATGTPLARGQAACEGCHRRSGFGSSEGQTLVPPVTAKSLYRPGHVPRAELAGSSGETAGARPAYTDASLRRAIRHGIGADGQPLSDLMPRFALSDAHFDLLLDYLKSLGEETAPGITADTIHLATVITPGVSDSRRAAMIVTLQTWFADLNAGTRQESRRSSHAPWNKAWQYESYRQFRLHIWSLTGPAGDWRAQLERHYARQPVFALVNGIGDGDSWQAIHEYCEASRIPCLFPTTDLPVTADGGFYSLYFSRGISLDAAALAKYLDAEGNPLQAQTVQVFRAGAAGAVAADVFRKALTGYGITRLRDRAVPASEELTAEFWSALLESENPARLVLWLGASDLKHSAALAANRYGKPPTVYLSQRLLERETDPLPDALLDIAYLIDPFALPEARERQLLRLTTWAHARKLTVRDERVMANAWFAAMITADAIRRTRGNLTREHVIEQMEHMVDNALFHSVYPHLSLGPDQRFASKGCHITRRSGGDARSLNAWVVPD